MQNIKNMNFIHPSPFHSPLQNFHSPRGEPFSRLRSTDLEHLLRNALWLTICGIRLPLWYGPWVWLKVDIIIIHIKLEWHAKGRYVDTYVATNTAKFFFLIKDLDNHKINMIQVGFK